MLQKEKAHHDSECLHDKDIAPIFIRSVISTLLNVIFILHTTYAVNIQRNEQIVQALFNCSDVLLVLDLQTGGLKLCDLGGRRLRRGGFERHLNSLSAILSFNHPMTSFLWFSDRPLNTSPNIFMLEREKTQTNVHANAELILLTC